MRMTHTRNWKLTRQHGFSLLEIVVVISIIMILMSLIIGTISNNIIHTQQQFAVTQMHTISMAMTRYTAEWDDFPPFDEAPPGYSPQGTTDRSASELLVYYLAQHHKQGESSVGGHLPVSPSNSVTPKDGKTAIVSPLKGFYSVGFEGHKETGRRVLCVIVDPGKDRLLGGRVDIEKGFIPDDSDANGDGKADHLDNLKEVISIR